MDTQIAWNLVLEAEQLVEALRQEIRFSVMLGQYSKRDKAVELYRSANARLHRRQQLHRNLVATSTTQCTCCNGTGWTQWAYQVTGNCTNCYGFGVVSIDADGTQHVVTQEVR